MDTVKRILPYALVAMLIAGVIQSIAPGEFFKDVFNMTAPFNVPVAAAVGIPIYGGTAQKFLAIFVLSIFISAVFAGYSLAMLG